MVKKKTSVLDIYIFNFNIIFLPNNKYITVKIAWGSILSRPIKLSLKECFSILQWPENSFFHKLNVIFRWMFFYPLESTSISHPILISFHVGAIDKKSQCIRFAIISKYTRLSVKFALVGCPHTKALHIQLLFRLNEVYHSKVPEAHLRGAGLGRLCPKLA